MTPARVRAGLLAALVVELVVMAWLLLNPSPAVPVRSVHGLAGWFVDRGFGDLDTLPERMEFVLNIAVFVPLGATLALLLPRVPWWTWLVVGLAAAGGVELTQYLLIDTRSAQWPDVWANAIGFAVGALAGSACRTMRGLGHYDRDRMAGL